MWSIDDLSIGQLIIAGPCGDSGRPGTKGDHGFNGSPGEKGGVGYPGTLHLSPILYIVATLILYDYRI